MKQQHRNKMSITLMSIFFFCMAQNAVAEEKQVNTLMPQPPRYELVLDINELNLLNESVSAGLNKYGGGINFELNAAKSDRGTLWKVIIKNPKLPDVLKYWISEKSLEVVKAVNPDKLSPDDKTALKAMKTLADKTDASRNNPVRDEIKISGVITEQNNNLFIKGADFQYSITGKHTNAIKKMNGKRVVIHGVVKVKDQIEAARVLIKKENTLELFVMSQCPFAGKAETALIDFIDTLPDDQKPAVSIRYIFNYKNKKFSSLHGEPEIMENLVQMVIRDGFREYFHPYLLKRGEDEKTPWPELAKEIGMSDEAVKGIEDKITKERQKLIQTEYNYAAGTYGIISRSPTYIWESEIIPDIRKIKMFKEVTFSTEEKCSH
ncbi:hypothetical protein QUF75_12475 [Desulfococcaceae bacterium HSG7]|nr:hypothetical protein [Desulfococcaceae bacterium HSG7]